jgi:anti-sigma factor RsiW
MTTANDDALVQYLLGRLPEKERLELQARLFKDDDLDEELLATTDDLVCAYLAGELPEEDRARFETHFLARPENREHLALMKDLLAASERVSAEDITVVKARPAPVHRALRWTLAAAAAVVAFALAAQMISRRPDLGHQQAAATRPPAAPAMVSAPTRPESPMPHVPPPPAVRVVRLAGKSGSRVNVRLAPSTRVVRAELSVDEESLSFDAAVLTADGKAVWRAEGLAPSAPGRPLVLEVPADVFASGQYAVRVEGEPLRDTAAQIREYRLQVTREP